MDEAKLRGIDVEQLRAERFNTRAHYKMVEIHEARARLFREYAKFSATPVESPKVSPVEKPVKSKKSARVRKDKYQFTDTQIRIAQAVLEQEKKKK